MKPEIYQALSQLNSSFVQIVESLKALHGQGIVTGDYVHEHDVRLSETCAVMNVHIIAKLSSREIEKPRSFWENARQI
ncbi:MAG: hypothetical protein DMG65_13095 [Candidatus Angelobacter sp. Gp1-AA117]|nr:MAG: hypothetical protein DMG65_13095 [Candidatus Angelobacter sp. Gp1-AA117]